MRYPALNKRASYTLQVPALNGGLNTTEALNMVDDNQLTDALNVWWKDGALRTRPGLHFQKKRTMQGKNTDTYPVEYKLSVKTYDGDGGLCRYLIQKQKYYDAKSNKDGYKAVIYRIPLNESIEMVDDTLAWDLEPVNFFMYAGERQTRSTGMGVFLLVLFEDNSFKCYELDDQSMIDPISGEKFIDIEDQLYAPLIYINGKGDQYSTLPTDEETPQVRASAFEGVNMLTGNFRARFMTDGVSTIFTVPVTNLTGEVRAIWYNDDGTVRCDWTAGYKKDENGNIIKNENDEIVYLDESNVVDSEYSFIVNRDTGSLTFNFAMDKATAANVNNLEIIASTSTNKGHVIAGMGFSDWFGGSADGVFNGSRLFASGNPNFPGQVYYTDLKNPLYWPENNYATIGNFIDPVTAIGKQEDMLVFFKQREMYYTTYVSGTNYTAADVMAGRVVDVTTMDATFPIIQIHDGIGCDCPDTVQLCNNRLIWTTSDGNVYALVGANQYSKTNVRRLSYMMDTVLRNHAANDLRRAYAFVYDEHYLLALRQDSRYRFYCLDFDSYYFKYQSSSTSERSQKKLNWWIWETPEWPALNDCSAENCGLIGGIVGEGKCNLIFVFQLNEKTVENYGRDKIYLSVFRFEDGSIDTTLRINYNFDNGIGEYECILKEEKNIQSMLQTKLFDFGAPQRYKKIEQLYMGVGHSADEAHLQYVTESGTLDGGVFSLYGENDDANPGFISEERFLPQIYRALRFGVRVECDGNIAVDNLTIQYKPMGGAR